MTPGLVCAHLSLESLRQVAGSLHVVAADGQEADGKHEHIEQKDLPHGHMPGPP